MSSQAIFQFCRDTKLDRDRSEKDSGSDTPRPTHPLHRRHGQDRNPGGPLQCGRTTNDLFSYKEFRSEEVAIPL